MSQSLQHYGILGMKWGVRKAPTIDVNGYSKQKHDLVQELSTRMMDTARLREKKKGRNDAQLDDDPAFQEDLMRIYESMFEQVYGEKYTLEADVRRSGDPELEKWYREGIENGTIDHSMDDKNALQHYGILGMKWGVRRTQAQLTNKPMTDEELRSRVNRMNMEKQYRDLSSALNPKKTSVVKKLLGEAFQNLGRQALAKGVGKIMSRFDKNDEVTDVNIDDMFGASDDKLSKAIKRLASEQAFAKMFPTHVDTKTTFDIERGVGVVQEWLSKNGSRSAVDLYDSYLTDQRN